MSTENQILPKFSNVFILCTGRCGSKSFINACKHISNYTSGHESRNSRFGEERLNYPRFHIEADNRLSWITGRLDKKYGDNAFYVHLTRNEDAVISSFARRFGGIMNAYGRLGDGIVMKGRLSAPFFEARSKVIAEDCVKSIKSNIDFFLKDKTHQMEFRLENAEADFKKFILAIGAVAEYELAIKAFLPENNPEPLPKQLNFVQKIINFIYKKKISFKWWIYNTLERFLYKS